MADQPPSYAKIMFRADGNAEIGSGHIRRCLSIATRLREWGAECSFVCRSAEHSFNKLVVEAGFVLIELPDILDRREAQDAEQTISQIGSHAPFHAMIVDHYGLGQTWESTIRTVARNVVVIDDLADRPHDCDVLIDVAPGEEARYQNLVPADARQLLGPKYALLRPEFRLHRNANRMPHRGIERILISFGGVDPDNLTAIAIHAIRQVMPFVAIDAVVTSLAPHLQMLNQIAIDDPNLNIHVDAGNMAALMQEADLAIGAGGSTSWERACMGLPSIVVVIADNQQMTAAALETLGCAVAVTAGPQLSEDIEHVVRTLNKSPALRQMMATAGQAAVDGRGVDRISRAIMPAEIVVRRATEQDSRKIWEWRNDPEIRATAIDPAAIAWESHRDWFARRIADASTVMQVAEERGTGVGVVRFDLDGNRANVSIFLAPGQAGRGLGRIILNAGECQLKELHPHITELHADVRPENEASIALFRGANYSASLIHFERNLDAPTKDTKDR
jgi:UDP-2,4-diacetamido-2,4,6-trideoxy-beta-L-altropyranose hydrolase